eukprot:6198929-Pleurochrysis_carterae.AAC.1
MSTVAEAPSTRRVVTRSCHCILALGSHAQRVDSPAVSLERAHVCTVQQPPHARRLVARGGVTHTDDTMPLCPSSVSKYARSARRNTRASWSNAPVTTCAPSGVTHTDRTEPLCPSSVRTCAPSLRRHTRAVASFDAVTTCSPSGVTHTAHTSLRCPLSAPQRGVATPSDSAQLGHREALRQECFPRSFAFSAAECRNCVAGLAKILQVKACLEELRWCDGCVSHTRRQQLRQHSTLALHKTQPLSVHTARRAADGAAAASSGAPARLCLTSTLPPSSSKKISVYRIKPSTSASLSSSLASTAAARALCCHSASSRPSSGSTSSSASADATNRSITGALLMLSRSRDDVWPSSERQKCTFACSRSSSG